MRIAALSLATLIHACFARSESAGELRAALGEERRQLEEAKQDVDRKLATTTDAAEREALLARQRRIAEEFRELEERERRLR